MVRARTAFAAVVLALLALPAAAQAVYVLGPDGTTAAVHSYPGAIRERVYIAQPGIDQDGNGVADDVAIEIIRPDTADPVPAIIDPSPYYTTVCRGNEGQCIGDLDSDGKNDKWPLFLDNYFVPRGYAVILAESNGTANSTGCPLHGGPGDVAGMRSVIDWLQGRAGAVGRTAPAGGGSVVTATWDNGKAAMIGKSYDGTLTEGVAATGVSGLTTIVPESAIDDWYAYSRMGGIRFNTHYPSSLSNTITDAADRAACAATRAQMNLDDGDATGDRNAFWEARDYRPGLAGVTASVLAVHGLQDDNVRMDHLASWWAGLAAHGVPRKLWLMRAGHVDPFDLRRAEWVDTLHRWFDHWLLGVDNHIMDAPRVDLQDADGTWHTESDWPAPGTQPVALHLRATDAAAAGDIGLVAGSGLGSVSWLDASGQSEATMMNNPGAAQVNRRVFLSAPLRAPLRISGTPQVALKAALDKAQSNLGALIVDYAPAGETMSQITRTGDGITTNAGESSCWGDDNTANGDYSACYHTVTQPSTTVSQWRVTKGVLDAANRLSLTTPTAVTIGTPDDFPITLIPQDHVFATGHRIAVILVANYSGFSAVNGTTGTTVTMDALNTTVSLPVVGGAGAAAASGGFDVVTPVLTVPADVAVAVAPSPAGAPVTYATPAATDDSDPSPGVSCAPASGTVFPVGATTVTCTATDASGNATTATFTVTVSAAAEPQAPPSGGGGGGTTGGETLTTPAPVTPPSGSAATAPEPPKTLDVVPVRLSKLTLSGRPGSVLATFALSADATVTIAITRSGAKRATKTAKATLKAGKRTVRVRAKALKPGRYVVVVTVRGANGTTATLRKALTIKR